jgi:hypothetical protein
LRGVFKESNLRLVPKAQVCTQKAEMARNSEFKWPNYPPGHEAYTMVCSQGELKALFFQDSMGTELAPLVSQHFNKITFIWDYPNYAVMNAAVVQERPDIVIEERVERHLRGMTPEFDIPSGLVGSWFNSGRRTEVNQIGTNILDLLNEHGSHALGIISDSTVVVKGWNVEGKVASDKSRIEWTNGTVWTR